MIVFSPKVYIVSHCYVSTSEVLSTTPAHCSPFLGVDRSSRGLLKRDYFLYAKMGLGVKADR